MSAENKAIIRKVCERELEERLRVLALVQDFKGSLTGDTRPDVNPRGRRSVDLKRDPGVRLRQAGFPPVGGKAPQTPVQPDLA